MLAKKAWYQATSLIILFYLVYSADVNLRDHLIILFNTPSLKATKQGDEVHKEIQRRRSSMLAAPLLGQSAQAAPLVDDSQIISEHYQVFGGSVAEGMEQHDVNVDCLFEKLYISKIQQLLMGKDI